MSQRYLRLIFGAVLMLCVITLPLILPLGAPQSFAQTPPQGAEEPAAADAAQALPDAAPQSRAINLDDPALKAALADLAAAQEALRKAKEAAGAAVIAQQDAAQSAGEPSAKASLVPRSTAQAKALLGTIFEKLKAWLTSPAFLAQIGAIILALTLAPFLARIAKKKVPVFRTAPDGGAKFLLARRYIYRSGEFLRAICLVLLLAGFAFALKHVPSLGQDWLVKLAQGAAVVFLLFRAIKVFLTNELLQKLAIWILIPLAILVVFGFYDDLTKWLNAQTLTTIADKEITAMTVVRLIIFGALFYKVGSYSNARGQSAIRAQAGLDSTTREVVAKIFQIILFFIIAVLVLTAAQIPLGGLVVIFSALSLGIGLGLQPIAANFVSGLIILFDRSVKVGDFVALPDGQMGHVEAINMRSTTVETADGKDIMVPNTKFTEDAYENWTHKDPRQRYEVHFSVHYDTDLDALEDILIPAVLAHPQVLREPELPDLELRGFGESGIDMAIEFWCEGIDDGKNKFTSDVNFIVWRTLKAHGITIPYPQREVRLLK